ncbi:glycosyltransferase [Chelativorans sp. AA-79]|uniref:glycosyltransferase n=1 Tax=Chelativorans sp. AA-79 TaxID=3028735 RepID=UPI0023F77ACF|nr:glycosyltransferase [Chelativorans sp. AA-79]WEX08345.1 glycosyltransferase [Chelativorans sp. AA-79]
MKVLHVFKTYLPDSFTGIERVIWEIAEGLAPEGVESCVLSLGERVGAGRYPVGSHFGYQAKRDLYMASTGLSLSVFKAFRELSRTADIVHYHFPWPMADLLHLLERPDRPTVVTYHSDIVRQRVLRRLYEPMMRRFLDGVDRIVATSPNYAESSAVLRRYRDKTSVIPIGLADEEAPSVALVEEWRQRMGEGFFLFVGALRYYKGLPFLLDAAERTGLPLVIAGKGAMEAEIRARKLPNLQLVETFSDRDKAALLHLCRAFVFPSHLRSEAFGVALLEAARAGKPMISCEIGTGTTYVNLDGETGLAVPPADAQALGEAMRKLAGDPQAVARMGQAARARYERLFKAEEMCRQYLGLYRTLS